MPTEAIKPVSTGRDILQEKPTGGHEILFEMVPRGMCSAYGGKISTYKSMRFITLTWVEGFSGSALLHPIIFIFLKSNFEFNTNSDNTTNKFKNITSAGVLQFRR
mmetsp:Transcript_44287/g.53513  ORF Transcript_44287/g.53513 Transcript_44287/m.53513 type:complete len:105 (+) Transcript_44287:397-711(+)